MKYKMLFVERDKYYSIGIDGLFISDLIIENHR